MQSTARTSPPSGKGGGHDPRIATLFMRFAGIYGHLWCNNYQNEKILKCAQVDWSQELRVFDDATLKKALLVHREQHPFPPTLPQFVECCKAVSRPKVWKPEIVKPAQPEVVSQALKNIRALLHR